MGAAVMNSPRPKRILYHGPDATQFYALVRSLAGDDAAAPASPCVEWADLACTFVDQPALATLVSDLQRHYVNLLLIDARCDRELDCRAARTLEALDALDGVADVEDRFGFHRIVVLVAGEATPATDALILEVGARGVGRVLRHEAFAGPAAVDPAWGARLREELAGMLGARRPGRRALCAAGGPTP